MERGSTLFLKIVVILMGLPVLAICIFIVPEIAELAAYVFSDNALIKYSVIVYLWTTAIPYYFALYQAFKLLSYIDKNQAFSEFSIKALKSIKNAAVTISVLWLVFMPIVYIMAEIDDAPGLILIGMAVTFAPMVIAVFAAVLQKLLKNAIDIKSENDLTV